MSDVLLQYSGTLDLSTVEQFRTAVEQAARDHDRVILDMTDLEFIDSTGVRGLITAKQTLAAEGKQLVVQGLSQDILDILDILGIRSLVLES